MSGGNLKLKLNTAQAAASPQTPANPTPTPTTLKLNLSRRPSEAFPISQTAPQTPATAPKFSRKNTAASTASTSATKKRKQADDKDAASSSKKTKIGPIRLASQPGLQKPLVRKGSIVKLKRGLSNSQQSPTTPGGGQVRALRVKHKGKLPPRPLGAGYDSEADEAEEDPAIEENLVLRMLPGPDCDYVRNAIEERKVGVPISQGGADVSLRFFTKDARRAALRVRDRIYAAVLVDLPCIVETMKSWDRKGWWKSADICQMLLVTEKVENEDAARNTPLPRELDTKTWQWPHGLTPPMYNVRKRRFRKRVSHKTIEQAELEVERLLDADEQAKAHGGISRNEVLDWEQLRREEEGDDGDQDEEDAEGDIDMGDDGYAHSQAVDDEDDADWQAQFEAQLGADDDEDEPETIAPTPAPAAATADDSQAPTPTADAETPSADAHPTAPEDETLPETPADPSASSDEDDDDDEDEDDDDDDDEEEPEEIDEETREKQQYLAQQREEITHLDRQIAERREQLAKQTNPLLKAKLVSTIKRFEEERDVKKRGLGDTDDDD